MVAIDYLNADHATRDRIITMLIHNGIIPKSVRMDSMDYDYRTQELSYSVLKASGTFDHSDSGTGQFFYELDPATNQWIERPVKVRLAWQPWEYDLLMREAEYLTIEDGGASSLASGAL